MPQTDEMTHWVLVCGVQAGRPNFNPWNQPQNGSGELTPPNSYMASTCISTCVHAIKHNDNNQHALVFTECITRSCVLVASNDNNVLSPKLQSH